MLLNMLCIVNIVGLVLMLLIVWSLLLGVVCDLRMVILRLCVVSSVVDISLLILVLMMMMCLVICFFKSVS